MSPTLTPVGVWGSFHSSEEMCFVKRFGRVRKPRKWPIVLAVQHRKGPTHGNKLAILSRSSSRTHRDHLRLVDLWCLEGTQRSVTEVRGGNDVGWKRYRSVGLASTRTRTARHAPWTPRTRATKSRRHSWWGRRSSPRARDRAGGLSAWPSWLSFAQGEVPADEASRRERGFVFGVQRVLVKEPLEIYKTRSSSHFPVFQQALARPPWVKAASSAACVSNTSTYQKVRARDERDVATACVRAARYRVFFYAVCAILREWKPRVRRNGRRAWCSTETRSSGFPHSCQRPRDRSRPS